MEHELSLQEIQDCEYEILKYFSEVCHKNGLKYYLFYGTLIGAVRHHDFIPWDDDVDVVMLRDDYNKLINILKSDSKYRLLTSEIDDYYFPFAKLVDPNTRLVEKGMKPCSQMGVWIDIFPLDKVPKNKSIQQIQYKSIRKLIGLIRYISATEETVNTEITTNTRKLKHKISKLFHKNSVINMIERIAGLYRNSKEYELANLVWSTKYVAYTPEWYDDPISLPFRSSKLDVPSQYDGILTAVYGNYMKLPPEDRRYSNHNYKCWRTEDTK